ncbi:MAG: transporter substrate-binding domain-containing protein [Bdellovibrionota bacterium]
MNKLLRVLLTLLFPLLTFVNAANAVNQVNKTSTFQKIQSTKQLKVCAESGYLPLEMKTASGKWLGFDVDMMEAYAQSIGAKLVMLDTKWDGIIPSLASGKCDAIASSMAVTKERENVVSFSNPYYENKFLIAIKNSPNNIKKFTSLSDFNNSNVTIAVKTGSSPDLFIQNSKMFSEAKILKFDADADTVSAVLNGRADAFIYDTPYVKLAALHYPGKLYIAPQSFNGDYFAVAFRKQDNALLENFNVFLSNWKQQNNYIKTMNYYFEDTQWTALLNK